MDETALLLTRMEELARRAEKTGMAHSKFLSPAQCAAVQQAFSARRDVALHFEGGFACPERQVAVFTQPQWGGYQPEEILAGLALGWYKDEAPRHQDVLGAALGLGLSREVLGDILLEQGGGFLVCLRPMAAVLAAELCAAGRARLKLEEIPLAALPSATPQLVEKRVTVASPRLDAVLAAAWNWPRAEAAEAIRAGRVQLGHQPCQNVARLLQEGEVFSVRGKGRVKLLKMGDSTRKGRQWLSLGFYM